MNKKIAFLCLASVTLMYVSKTEGGTLILEEKYEKYRPCPDPDDILPCICTLDDSNRMTMNCSSVADEDELERVFSAELPFYNFEALVIKNNQNLRSLRGGALGAATFKRISLTQGLLESLEEDSLASSLDTLQDLDLEMNRIPSFPFHILPSFPSLRSLSLRANRLEEFPRMRSDSLQVLNLGLNSLVYVPTDALRNLPNLSEVYLDNSEVEVVHEATFAGFKNLHILNLSGNVLTHLPWASIVLEASSTPRIFLFGNLLQSVVAGAIQGIRNGQIFLPSNRLSRLEEATWRTILEDNNELFLEDNPLLCGCDVAWLVRNASLLRMTRQATCSDGELLVDLDPSIFDLC